MSTLKSFIIVLVAVVTLSSNFLVASTAITQVASPSNAELNERIRQLRDQLDSLIQINANLALLPATFIKTYHLWDKTKGLGVVPLKSGGYLLTGDVISAAGVYYPFVVRTDASGDIIWSKKFSSSDSAYSVSSSRHIVREAVETVDGNIVMVSDVVDFYDQKYEDLKEAYGDILVTKLNTKGSLLWSVMLGEYGIDAPERLWALPDGGITLLAKISINDESLTPTYGVLVNIDSSGKVVSIKKLNWDILDMERLADGSFIALINVKVATGKLPTMVKLTSALNVEWAKSIESVPMELNTPTLTGTSTLTLGVTKIRVAGGDFKAVQSTSDGGFIAFGFASLPASQLIGGGMSGGSIAEYLALRPLVAVKVSAAGKYLWARKLTGSLSAGTAADFHVTKTSDSGFIVLQDVLRDSGGKSTAIFSGANIELIKTDADFNPRWIKKYDVEKSLSGYDIKSTFDGGAVVAGVIETTRTHMVMGSPESYLEAGLLKVDVNGGAGSCAIVSDHPKATIEDWGPYLIMQNMEITGVKDFAFHINKKVGEKVSATAGSVRTTCEYQKSASVPINSYLSYSKPDVTSTPIARTLPLVNFDSAKEVGAGSGKNKRIHDELLPVLKQVYNNQVKLTDSASGMWLTYTFSRIATRADVEVVQKYFEKLGYKIDESDKGILNISKVGTSIRMTFYINNTAKGKLDVMF